MGVAGAGKTVVGHAVAERLGWRFVDGDGHHPAANRAKMAAGTPLTDDDRRPWLDRLRALLDTAMAEDAGTVL
ncbi:MAG: gluconokinase, partial [bacterium]|nr:gluconokinase [bacterium]